MMLEQVTLPPKCYLHPGMLQELMDSMGVLITGPAGAGKSSLVALLFSYGAFVLDGDSAVGFRKDKQWTWNLKFLDKLLQSGISVIGCSHDVAEFTKNRIDVIWLEPNEDMLRKVYLERFKSEKSNGSFHRKLENETEDMALDRLLKDVLEFKRLAVTRNWAWIDICDYPLLGESEKGRGGKRTSKNYGQAYNKNLNHILRDMV